MRVLLVEDDELLGVGVLDALTHAGYATDWLKDGESANIAFETENYDLCVLDWGLPRLSGLDLLKRIRKRGITTPVLLLTARDTVDDRVTGLDSGADDYLVKPFDLDELLARTRALVRRASGRASPVIEHGDIRVDPASHSVTKNGTVIEISPREFALLQNLLDNKGRVVSKARLEESLYAWSQEVESNTIEVHIHHLRKKLGNTLIRTIRGVGYIVDK